MPDTQAVHLALGMTDEEYADVCSILDRKPAPAELAMYSVMWSEHCSYKSSRAHLGRLPSEAPWVVVGPGENAGVIDLGDGWLAALRIESHNHPSFVEPYQGAATGVGGILRDVFTMGARPIALWDQIRFGSLDDPHTRYLFTGVVAGIAGYGNAVGVPTVGGEIDFDPSYAGNPLVNVMCLGILRTEQLVLGTAGPPGSIAVLLGSATGRDGIGGASVLASASFDTDSGTKRPSVQVGDPFEEKKLIEACLELYQRDLVVGVQDLGAAGLSCATSEPAGRAGVGMDVDLDAVHTREPGMTAPELLMSESQERMMAFVTPENVAEVLAVSERWEIDAAVVGTVKEGSTLKVFHGGDLVAEIPAASLADDAPRLNRVLAPPADLAARWEADPAIRDELRPTEALRTLLDDPALADPSWAYSQYDHMLFLNTLVEPGHDGSLLRLKGTQKGLAVSTDGNGYLCALDPRRGAERLVYEAAMNVAVVGATPKAVVDNLNFGNPEKPEVMWQLSETIDGIAAACNALGIPVVGGNVSLYNETEGVGIHPTPVIGLLGVADPTPTRPPRLDAATEPMDLFLLGGNGSDLAGSVIARHFGEHVGRPTPVDATFGKAVIGLIAALAHDARVAVLHDISEGGLAMAAAEVAIRSRTGVRLETSDLGRLFSEDPHRAIVGILPGHAEWLKTAAESAGVPSERVGSFGGDTITMGDASLSLDEATLLWTEAIPRRVEATR